MKFCYYWTHQKASAVFCIETVVLFVDNELSCSFVCIGNINIVGITINSRFRHNSFKKCSWKIGRLWKVKFSHVTLVTYCGVITIFSQSTVNKIDHRKCYLKFQFHFDCVRFQKKKIKNKKSVLMHRIHWFSLSKLFDVFNYWTFKKKRFIPIICKIQTY